MWISAFALLLIGIAASASADTRRDVLAVHGAAQETLRDVPELVFFEDISPFCAGQSDGMARVRYCEGSNRLGISRDDDAPDLPYWVARVLAYAAQDQYRLASDAERRIYREPGREAEFRQDISKQGECLAGRLYQLAGLARPDVEQINADSAGTLARWGRGPYRSGSQIALHPIAQATWFDRGYTSEVFVQCTVGPFSGLGLDGGPKRGVFR